MEENRPGFMQDDNGNNSLVRAMSIVCLIVSIIIGLILVYKSPDMKDPFTGIYVFTAFLVGAFAPKVIQKFAENMPNMFNKR